MHSVYTGRQYPLRDTFYSCGLSYDEDSPKLTKAQIARLRPAHEAYWNVTPVKKTISIKIDADILAALQSGGKGYQTKINSILRKAITTGDY